MSKPRALFWFPKEQREKFFSPELRERLEKSVNLVEPDSFEPSAFPDLLRDCDCVFSTWGMPALSDQWIDQAPRLKAIFYAAGSVKSWVCDRCFDREILITSTAGVNAIPVAEYTVAMIVLCLKNVPRFFQAMRNPDGSGWNRSLFSCVGVGAHTTIGIIGASKIGRLVIPELQRLTMRVLVTDPFLTTEEATRLGVEKVELMELMQRSDVVSLHAPNLPATYRMLRREHFAAMKPGAVFINTARGALVDEEGLIAVLREGAISAVLDVTDPEPPVAGSPLYSLPNCFLTPHVAGTYGLECRRMCLQSIEEVERFYSGRPPIEAITRQMLATMA